MLATMIPLLRNLAKCCARPIGRAFVFMAVAAVSGCFAGPDPLPPEQALAAAHGRITRLLEQERAFAPDAITVVPSQTPATPDRITVWYPAHPIIAPALGRRDVRAVFERAHPEVRLDAQFIGEWHVAIQKLTVSIAAGDVPDIALVDRSWAARLAQAGHLMPLDGFLTPKVLDDVHPHVRAAYTLQGRVWALPADGFCSVLYFNRDLVAEPPQTWADLRDAGPHTDAPGALGHLPYVESLWSAGGVVCELNQSGLTAPPAIRTLDFLIDLRDTGRVAPRMLENPGWAFETFLRGNVAMTAGSSEWFPRTGNAAFTVGMAPLPGEEGPVSRLGDKALVVFARHARAKRAGIVAVLDFLTGPAVQGAEAASRGSVPVRQSVLEGVDVPEGLRDAYEAAQAPPFIGVWTAVEHELLNYLGLAYRWQPEEGGSEERLPQASSGK